MNAQEIISSGLLELYVMGIASPEETRNVEQWAKQYPEVAAELNAIASAMESYAQVHAIEPAASVKENIFKTIGGSSSSSVTTQASAKVYSISPAWKYAAAASIILLVGSLIFNYTYYDKYKTANDDLQVAQTELKQIKEMAQSMDTTMRVMSDGTPVALKSMDTAADMSAKIYWVKNTSEVYIDPANLPKAPDGKQYEFWAIVDGAPVNGGIITEVNGKTVRLQKMKSFGKAQAFAVSLEEVGPAKKVPAVVKAMGNI